MILEELLNILEADTSLATLLGASVTNSKIMPMPLITDGVGFDFIPLINDGAITQSVLELTIANTDMFSCYEIKDKIDNLLITIGNNELTSTITGVSANGGGFYFDDDLKMYKLKTNYTVISR